MGAVLDKKGFSRGTDFDSEKREKEQGFIKINRFRVPITNPGKILYPEAHFTKAHVIDYYREIGAVLLPHLKNRLLTMKRYPNGVEAPFFYEKRCPQYRPDFVETAKVPRRLNREEISFCMVNNLATLIWAANLADLELHTSLAKATNLDCPTAIVFDLDPGEPATILQCAEVALWLRRTFEQLKLKSFVKTSGSKGLQVYLPLNSSATFAVTKAFARKLAESMEEQNPGLVVSKMARSQRKGKVLVDWSQNDAHKTTVCAYSLRARKQPTVSAPIQWEEAERAWKEKDVSRLSLLPDQVLQRVKKHGDIFAPVLKLKQKVPDL